MLHDCLNPFQSLSFWNVRRLSQLWTVFSQLECRSNGQSTIYLSGTIKSGNEEERLDQTVPISRVQCAGILAKVVNFNQCGEGTLNFGRFTVKKTISSYYGFASTSYAVGDVDLTQFEGMGTTGRCLR